MLCCHLSLGGHSFRCQRTIRGKYFLVVISYYMCTPLNDKCHFLLFTKSKNVHFLSLNHFHAIDLHLRQWKRSHYARNIQTQFNKNFDFDQKNATHESHTHFHVVIAFRIGWCMAIQKVILFNLILNGMKTCYCDQFHVVKRICTCFHWLNTIVNYKQEQICAISSNKLLLVRHPTDACVKCRHLYWIEYRDTRIWTMRYRLFSLCEHNIIVITACMRI